MRITARLGLVLACFIFLLLASAGCRGNLTGDAVLGSPGSGPDSGGSASAAMVAPNAPCPVGQALCDGRCV